MTETLSIAEFKKRKPSKYRAVKTVVDGIRFDSRKEAARWKELRMLQATGQISRLNRQVKFDLEVNGIKVGRYVGDFSYVENRKLCVEDVKGYRDKASPVYRLFKIKAALVRALYSIEVREI
jgi:hypothetical protein